MRGPLIALLAFSVTTSLIVEVPVARAAQSEAHRSEGEKGSQLRGTIIDGLFTTGYSRGCDAQPDCFAWVTAGCPPELARIDPAWHTSIAAVASRAGTARAFEVRLGSGASVMIGGVVVQFWTEGCVELPPAWESWNCSYGGVSDPECTTKQRIIAGARLGREWTRTTFSIPKRATWMTVSAHDNLNLQWTLQ